MIQEEGKNKIREFTDLIVWQEGHKLVLLIYKITKNFVRDEVFGLTSQMRRATVSITSNIAEGLGRHGYKEKIQFYYLAQGSLTELKNQIIISRDLLYVNEIIFGEVMSQAGTTHKLLQGLIKKSKTFINPES